MSVPTAIKIDVTRGLRIGSNRDREGIPLGNSHREDQPAQISPVEASVYSNVLPTDRGYRSSFALAPVHKATESVDFKYIIGDNQQEAAKASPKQKVLWVETGSLHRIGLMFGEDGIWMIAPSLYNEDEAETGLPVFEYVEAWRIILPMTFEAGVRYLWTTCTIDGVIFAYRQGSPTILVLGDFGYTPKGITPTVVWENDFLQFRIHTTTPTFINMEGQIGLFRADNRLGFWDSDNSIAWSSATDKLEFTPDATTFAGITKYSEVSGVITSVLEHGKGFIIYATRSIVHCSSMPNSPEKWAGNAVTDNSGVLYDTQIAVGHPSTTHYAWVDGSMAVISNGSINFSLPELADFVRESNFTPMLTAPCSRYLYVSLYRPTALGQYERRARVLQDSLGRPFYTVPGYTFKDITDGLVDFWSALLDGGLTPFDQDEFVEPVDPVEDLPSLQEENPLIPFFSGHKYHTPSVTFGMLDWEFPATIPTTHPIGTLPSQVWPHLVASRKDQVYYPGPYGATGPFPNKVSEYVYTGTIQPQMAQSEWDMTAIDIPETRYLDKAGEEFIEVIQTSMTEFLADMDTVNALVESNGVSSVGGMVFRDQDSYVVENVGGNYFTRKDSGWEWGDIYEPACTIVKPPKPIDAKAPDWEEQLMYAVIEGDLTRFPGIKLLDLGIVSGYLPVSGTPRVTFDGCELRVQVQVDQYRCIYSEGVSNESIYVNAKICTETPPPEPIYSFNEYTNGSSGSSGYKSTMSLVLSFTYFPDSFMGKTRAEIKDYIAADDSPLWTTILSGKISGWGYSQRVSSTWTRYVKTHTVSIFKPCEPKSTASARGYIPEQPTYDRIDVNYPNDIAEGIDPSTLDQYKQDPIVTEGRMPSLGYWYPSLMPVSANFLKGTKHPYYPTCELALVYDNLLQKWGSMNTPHQLVYTNYPTNSNSEVQTGNFYGAGGSSMLAAGIIPIFYTPELEYWNEEFMWERVAQKHYPDSYKYLTAHRLPCGLSANGSDGMIGYTKIGLVRAGHTLFTGISAKVYGTGMGVGGFHQTMQVELGASLNNLYYENSWSPDEPWYAPSPNQLHRYIARGIENYTDLEAPARVIGRWATVILRGSFDLTGLTLYGKPAGRVRYFQLVSNPQ